MKTVTIQTTPVNAPAKAAAPAKPATPDRATRWVIAPYNLPTGGRMGMMMIRVKNNRDFYRVVWLEQDDMWTKLEVKKELPDGTFAEPYYLTLPAPGCYRGACCSCPGWRHGGKCRHSLSLTTLLSKALQ